MFKYKGLHFILAAIVVCGSLTASGKTAEYGPMRARLFKAVAEYDYGPDRTALAAMDSMLLSMLNQPEQIKTLEKQIDQQLSSEISPAAKAYYCEKLILIGSKQSLPVLTAMLAVDSTYDMALYALTGMPDKNADKQLRRLLTQFTGRKQIGIIQALGARKDIGSLRELHDLINAEPDIARAALLAIGRTGSRKSIPALQKAWIRTKNPELLLLLHETMMKCTEELDDRAQKSKIYAEIMHTTESAAVRSAAFRGWILSDPSRAENRILRTLGEQDSIRCCEGVSLLYQLEKTDHALWASRLSACPPRCQISLLNVMAGQKWTDAQTSVIPLLNSPDADVRSASLFTLSQIGDSVCVTAVAEHATGPLESSQAREVLDRLSGPSINPAMIALLNTSEPAIQKELIAALGRRNAREALEPVAAFSSGTVPGLRITAIEALGNLGNETMIEDLLNQYLNAVDGAEKRSLEKAILSITDRYPDFPVIDSLIVPLMHNKPEETVQITLLEFSGKTGRQAALPLLETALSEVSLSSAAIRGLSGWPDAGPVPELLELSESSVNTKDRILALRGALRLIEKDENLAGPVKLDLYKKALAQKPATAEVRLILSGLSKLDMIEAMDQIAPYLDREDLKTDAETASIKILEESWWRDQAKAAEYLNRLKNSENPWVSDTAAKLLIRLM